MFFLLAGFLTTYKIGIIVLLKMAVLAFPKEEGASYLIRVMAIHWSIKIWSLNFKTSSILIQEHGNIISMESVQSLLQYARGRAAQRFQYLRDLTEGLSVFLEHSGYLS